MTSPADNPPKLRRESRLCVFSWCFVAVTIYCLFVGAGILGAVHLNSHPDSIWGGLAAVVVLVAPWVGLIGIAWR